MFHILQRHSLSQVRLRGSPAPIVMLRQRRPVVGEVAIRSLASYFEPRAAQHPNTQSADAWMARLDQVDDGGIHFFVDGIHDEEQPVAQLDGRPRPQPPPPLPCPFHHRLAAECPRMLQYTNFMVHRTRLPPRHAYQGLHVAQEEGVLDPRSLYVAEVKCVVVDGTSHECVFALPCTGPQSVEAAACITSDSEPLVLASCLQGNSNMVGCL